MKEIILISMISMACMSCATTYTLSENVETGQSSRIELESIENKLEQIWDAENMESDIEELLDEWAELRSDPIYLNKATYEDLLRLPGFRPSYARALLRYRKSVGRFSSNKELESIKGIPQDIWEHAKGFTTLGSPVERLGQSIFNIHYWTPNDRFESISRVKIPIERSAAYTSKQADKDRAYAGSPAERYQRLTYHSKRIKSGITMRSDPGEIGTWMKPSRQYTYLQISDLPLISNIVVGDYRLGWGLGLAMNGSRSPKKGSELIQLSTKKNDLSVHSGSSYLGHYSGLALSMGANNKLSVWGSRRAYSASEMDSTTMRWTTSEPYFRTNSEVQKRDNLEIETIGFRLSHSNSVLRWGISTWNMRSDKRINFGNTTDNETSDPSRQFSMIGSDLQMNIARGSIAAEIAFDRAFQPGVIIAGELNPVSHVNISSIYRNYSSGFQSPFGAAFSAWSGQPANEVGIYAGLELLATSQIRTLFFIDHYKSHLPRSRNIYPSKGSDVGWKTSIEINKKIIELYARHRVNIDEIEKFDAYGRAFVSRGHHERFNVRFDVKQASQVRIDWATRAEWVQVTSPNGKTEQGHQLYQELVWKPSSALRLQARVAVFSTEGYLSRVYVYEPDVALSSVLPAFQGQGTRHFVLMVYRPKPNIETRFKWAKSYYPHDYSLGSGNDQIMGNQKTTIHLSLRVRV
jgi:hypothetical protein